MKLTLANTGGQSRCYIPPVFAGVSFTAVHHDGVKALLHSAVFIHIVVTLCVAT